MRIYWISFGQWTHRDTPIYYAWRLSVCGFTWTPIIGIKFRAIPNEKWLSSVWEVIKWKLTPKKKRVFKGCVDIQILGKQKDEVDRKNNEQIS